MDARIEKQTINEFTWVFPCLKMEKNPIAITTTTN